jgi:hypothetical protein
VGNLTTVIPLRRLGLYAGLLLGAVVLALFVLIAVILPKAEGSTSISLPKTLPGGYSALDSDRALPSGLNLPDDYLKQQAALVKSIQGDYDDTYDEPVAFRAYADSQLQSFAIVTVFDSEGGAFGPNFGTSDQITLKKVDDAVCVTTYQQTQSGTTSTTPDTVTCQLPDQERTVQVATSGASVAETAKLTHEVADAL